MKLLNVRTGVLEDHVNPPPYVILSHRWEDNEVTLQSYSNGSARESNGFRKIQAFLQQVQSSCSSIQYAWVDTCCIDKTSSAELSEAINSMYRWYSTAVECFAYLSDVESRQDLNKSAWFTRGWTLQELIAPTRVRFYNKTWELLGSKIELKADLHLITGVDEEVLQDPERVFMCSVAKRMSWAAHRQTTRVEDRAYSLMGLFEVNMPMLYGEGEKSFYRLQQEIIRESNDQSIFAWKIQPSFAPQSIRNHDIQDQSQGFSLIAHTVDQFADSRNIFPFSPLIRQLPFSSTNIGLSITLFLLPWTMHVYIGLLDCGDWTAAFPQRYCIFLRRLDEEEQFARITIDDQNSVLLEATKYQLILHQVPAVPTHGMTVRVRTRIRHPPDQQWLYGFHFRGFTTTRHGAVPKDCVTAFTHLRDFFADGHFFGLPDGVSGTVATIVVRDLLLLRKVIYVRLGFTFNFEPVILITLETEVDSDISGFARPANHQLRAENGCSLHNWLKEVVENQGRQFEGKKETLVMYYPGRSEHYDRTTTMVSVSLYTKMWANKLFWSLGIDLDIDALRKFTGETPASISDPLVRPSVKLQ